MLLNRILRVCFNFFPRTGIQSIFLLCRTVRNGIPREFCSTEWFRTEFRELASIFVPWYRIPSFFSSAERFGAEFIEFSVSRNSRNPAGTNQLFRLFRLPQNIFFWSKIANPSYKEMSSILADQYRPRILAQSGVEGGVAGFSQ
jgi:hypothetical protein